MYITSNTIIYQLDYRQRPLKVLSGTATAYSSDGAFSSSGFINLKGISLVNSADELVLADFDNLVRHVNI